MMKRLLAKSFHDKNGVKNLAVCLQEGFVEQKPKDENGEENLEVCLLSTHLRMTYLAAKVLCDLTADRQMEICGLTRVDYRVRFRRILLLAAAIHDLGKANSHFQDSVRGKRGQSIRHEWVLYVLLRFSPLGDWVKRALPEATREEDFTYLVWAITGHHRKAEGAATLEHPGDMELLCGEEDFRTILVWLSEQDELGLNRPDFEPGDLGQAVWKMGSNKSGDNTIDAFLKGPGNTLYKELPKAIRVSEPNEEDDEEVFDKMANEFPMMAAIRSSLMAADVAASAAADPKNGFTLGDEEAKMSAWINKRLGIVPTRDDFHAIVALKQAALPTVLNDPLSSSRSDFQNQTAKSSARVTLCIAGCGSGKTFAAWLWAAAVCQQDGNRLFFCYPTTGTATEGFLDYLIEDFPNEEGLKKFRKLGHLIHSRSGADSHLIDTIAQAEEERKERQKSEMKKGGGWSSENDANEADAVMKSLKIWRSGVVCCTVDTVLKFLVGAYSGHLAWPAFAQSIFVFDEIHSYDETLFARLLAFLKIVRGAKILLMTASLPKARQDRLKDVLKSCGGFDVVTGPKSWEWILRYRRYRSEKTPVEIAMEQYRAGKKILWVCNTVGRAIDMAKQLRKQLGNQAKLIVYHSRFKYKDRVKRHQECIDAFKGEGPVICVTTQVAEMSLDLSADFLLTDAAPISALIQRLGRLNRRAIADDAWPFFVIEPRDDNGEIIERPYSFPWFEQTKKWLELLGDAPLSQSDLTEKWSELSAMDPEMKSGIPEALPWNAAGPWMSETNLRDLSSSCEVLLQQDVKAVRYGGRAAYVEYVIPMSDRKDRKKFLQYCSKYGCFIDTSEVVDYSEEFGGMWNEKKEEDEMETPEGIKEIMIF